MFDRIITVMLTVAALAIAVAFVRREFRDASDPPLPTERTSNVRSVEPILATGVTIGPPGVLVRLVETIKAVIAGRPFPEAAFPGARAAR